MKTQYIYIYNDSFVSLLNLIKKLILEKIIPENIKNNSYQPNLLDQIIKLNNSEDNSVIEFIKIKFGIHIFNTIYYIFLSSDDNKELIIYYFLVHSIKYGNKIFYMRNLKSVSKALKIRKYVSSESHRFKGFLRFRELENGILYGKMEPENNILLILSKHFKERLKNEYWIIHDVKRKILSIYDQKDFYLVSEDNFKLASLDVSKIENNIEVLWKNFYETIGIKERKNDRCRMNFMPKKYWKYIIEVSEEYEKNSK